MWHKKLIVRIDENITNQSLYIHVYGYTNLCNKWLCIMNKDVSSLGSDALINKVD